MALAVADMIIYHSFEWDVREAARNMAQHGVSYEPSGTGEEEPAAEAGASLPAAAPRKLAPKLKGAAKTSVNPSGVRRRR